MLIGATGKLAELLARQTDASTSADAREHTASALHGIFVTRRKWGAVGLDADDLFASDPANGSWLYLSGNPTLRGPPLSPPAGRTQVLLRELSSRGLQALSDLHGAFAIAWWDAGSRCLRLIRDRFGVEPFYYAERNGALEFASRIRDLPSVRANGFRPSRQGILEFVTFCFLPDNATLDAGVWRVPPGGVVEFDLPRGTTRTTAWYRLSYRNTTQAGEQEIASEFKGLLEKSVVRQLTPGSPGAFLSGGMDSSSVVTFMTRHLQEQIQTFGFRCGGASFDESYYARALAEELGASHCEVTYDEVAARRITEAIEVMEVPFCDIGIEIGTWILASAAAGRIDYLLTGDGGDEFWASHPVYAAQKLVRFYDRAPIPRAVRSGIVNLTNLAHDTDRKRSPAVIIKRLLPSPDLDPALGPFRWRTYYTPKQLAGVLSPEFAPRAGEGREIFRGVLAAYDGYDGPDDGISPHLYADYTTASSFYLSRLMLCRTFGFEVRLPFYDHPLVEFGATVPARLKLEGIERTKRLFRVAMDGTLPDVINRRGDKLGHSVPLKNWLRGSGELGNHVRRALTDPQAPVLEFMRRTELDRLYLEHESGRHNHSHRLWAAFVLNGWLQHRQRMAA
jgi:asparagine synthase (glutamine-hydrolysing)